MRSREYRSKHRVSVLIAVVTSAAFLGLVALVQRPRHLTGNASATRSPSLDLSAESTSCVGLNPDLYADGGDASTSVPRIIHQTGKMDHNGKVQTGVLQEDFAAECRRMYRAAGWKYCFWDDETTDRWIAKYYPRWYEQWSQMTPFIRKVDTARSFWMHAFGGVYVDLDAECFRPMEPLVKSLPAGSTAWIGGFPEPFFMMSTSKHPFFLLNVQKVLSEWRSKGVRDSSGPQGFNEAVKQYITENGGPASVRPFAPSNTSEVARLQPIDRSKKKKQQRAATKPDPWQYFVPRSAFASVKSVNATENKIGFLPNYAVDPTACLAFLKHCRNTHCHNVHEIVKTGAYFVHHCLFVWNTL